MSTISIGVKNGDLLETFNEFFRSLLDKKIVDALLVPQEVSSGKCYVQSLVKDPSKIRRVNPIAPILLVNGAKLVSSLTIWEPNQKIGVVLRPCEIRALIELVKFEQASLDQLFIIGIDCLGTFEPTDYSKIVEDNKDSVLEDFLSGELLNRGYKLRTACEICEYPVPDNADMSLGIIGVNAKEELFLQGSDEVIDKIGLDGNKISNARESAVSELISKKLKRKDEVLKEFREKIGSLEGLLSEFANCKRCYNCRVECPICYCKECIFLTRTFEHKPDQYLKWAARKGAIKLPNETLLYHLTRLNHMATSCIGCGQCSSACPNDLPVFELFRLIGMEVQKIFDYVPGREVEEEPPVVAFKEEELEPL